MMKLLGKRKRSSSRQDNDLYLQRFCVGEWTYDVTTQSLSCSDDVYEIVGIDKEPQQDNENVLLMPVMEEDRMLVSKCWDLTFMGKTVGALIYRIVRSNKVRIVYCPTTNHYDSQGKLTSVSGKIRDVTDKIESDIWKSSTHTNYMTEEQETASIYVDKQLRVVKVSQKAAELLGWTENELFLKEMQHVPTRYIETQKEIYNTILKHGGCIRFDTVRLTKDGTPFNIGATSTPVYSANGQIVGVRGVYTNVLEQDDGNRLLFEIEKQVIALVQNSSDVGIILNKDIKVNYVSPAIENVLGYTPEEFIHMDPKTIVHTKDREMYRGITNELLSNPTRTRTLELRLKNKHGEWRHCSVRIRYLSEQYGMEGIIVNFNDVTEIRRNQEFIQYMNSFDPLTNLPNFKMFKERLTRLLGMQRQKEQQLAVAIIDINRFRYINDTLGITTGESLVKYIAEEFKEKFSNGHVFSRMGEHTFAVAIPYIRSKDEALEAGNAIVRLFHNPINVNERDLFITCNIGISIFPYDGKDTDALIKNAAITLRHGRTQRGPNTVYLYSATLNTKAYKEFSLVNDFRNALKNEEFIVYYQPRMNTVTGDIIGAEALIRWEHKEWGLIAPSEFLPLAEENSLIVPLGMWVLERVCAQVQYWKDKGYRGFCISVNFSVKQLLDANMVSSTKEILDKYKITSEDIEIEITETTIIPDDPRVVSTIRELRALGFRVYFDDFGTGYSSLSWLYQFEIDGIKLDRLFISQLPDNDVPKEIVASLIKLAHSLNLAVVAEGVENKRQLEFLQGLNCDQVQGYLYSKAVSKDDFEQFLDKGINLVGDNNEVITDDFNRRKYFRVYLETPMKAMFTVTKIGGKGIYTGYSSILVMDIGPGGLRFISDLQFPEQHDIVLNFKIKVADDEELLVPGEIVWKSEYGDQLFQYGVELVVSEVYREKLIRTFNDLAIQIQNGNYLGDEFYHKNVYSFFRQ